MGNFQGGGNRGGGFRGGNSGGRPSYGGGNRGGDRGPVTMHKATCDECHKSCEVPFRPSGDKPVYCNDCFSSKRGNDDRGSRKDFGGDRAPRREFSDRPAQTFAKPAAPSVDMSKQLGDISAKLDRLLGAIEKMTQPKAEAKPVVKVTPVVAKVEVKKAAVVKAPVKKVVAKKKK